MMTVKTLARALESPLGTLRALTLDGSVEVANEVVDLLLASGHLGALTSLSLRGVPVSDADLGRLLDGGADHLETLLLGGIDADVLGRPFRAGQTWAAVYHCDVGASTLEAVGQLPALRRVELSYALASSGAWLRFAQSASVSHLTALGMHMVPTLDRDAWRVLVERATAAKSLAFDNCSVGDVGAQIISRVPASSCLQRLALPFNGLTAHGALALLNAELPRLEALDLRGVALDDAMLRAFAARRGAPKLNRLVLDGCTAIPTGGVDTWYDQGQVVGESPELMRLQVAKRTYFAPGCGLEVSDAPGPWPTSWLTCF